MNDPVSDAKKKIYFIKKEAAAVFIINIHKRRFKLLARNDEDFL